jgi:hypothetical protein
MSEVVVGRVACRRCQAEVFRLLSRDGRLFYWLSTPTLRLTDADAPPAKGHRQSSAWPYMGESDHEWLDVECKCNARLWKVDVARLGEACLASRGRRVDLATVL